MRFLCVLALLIIGFQSATAQSFEARSKPFKLKTGKNQQVPEIQILEPPMGNRTSWFTSNRNPTLRGLALHSEGIKSVMANDVPASLEPNGSFSVALKLAEGINVITVVATSIGGSQATARLEFVYDNASPIVEILNPRPSKDRGIVNIQKDSVVVQLKVSDVSGVQSVLINGKPMQAINDSIYSCQVSLAEGENEFVIIATDKAGRQTERTVPVRRSSARADVDFVKGKAYALIIGIDKYKGVWPPLENAVRDARAVEDMLRNNFVFERISTLYDQEATRSSIISTLEDLGQNVLKPEDRLLVYYSGHGELKQQYNMGYWIPSDATRRSTAEYISDSEIRGYLGGMLANHVLLVADACFAADILKGPSESMPFQNTQDYFKTVARLKSRRALTSGGNEPVPDSGAEGHSWFAFYFLQALTNIEGKFFDAYQVYERLRIPVANNSGRAPRFDPINSIGDAGGQFIFVRK